jgi:hypothetical protein
MTLLDIFLIPSLALNVVLVIAIFKLIGAPAMPSNDDEGC